MIESGPWLLDSLRQYAGYIKGAVWLGFVVIGIATARAERGERSPHLRRRLVTTLLAYAMAVSFAAGLTQVDLWPFSAWSMMADVRDPNVGHARVFGVDAHGQEHPVDYRSWEPLQWEELIAWLGADLPQLPPDERDAAASFLLARAESTRARAARGVPPGYLDRFLDGLQAPEHMLHPKIWNDRDSVPPDPFVGLRVVWESWNVEQGRTDSSAIERVVIHDYARPR